jgi:hypothetical protein
MKNVVIYDCEIAKAILRNGEEGLPDIAYCAGWRDFKGMGLSVAGVYEYAGDRYRVFGMDNLAELAEVLRSAGMVIGFNSAGFDRQLLAAQGVEYDAAKDYDLLVELWTAAGLAPSWQGGTHAGFGLEATAKANQIGHKTGHGATAPVDWQQGRVATVVDYCLHDVWLTKQLVDLVLTSGRLYDPRDRFKILEVRKPAFWD